MDFVKEMELRRRAKVPIISLIHGNNIGVDISCGVLSKDTTDLVVKLLTHSGGAALFVPISSVLKIFLHQFGFDEPYLGDWLTDWLSMSEWVVSEVTSTIRTYVCMSSNEVKQSMYGWKTCDYSITNASIAIARTVAGIGINKCCSCFYVNINSLL